MNAEDACCRDSEQVGKNEEHIGAYLCYTGDSLLMARQLQLGDFVPDSVEIRTR